MKYDVAATGMKLIVRVQLDLVGRQDSVQNLVELFLAIKTVFVSSILLFAPWEKNRDPGIKPTYRFLKSKK